MSARHAQSRSSSGGPAAIATVAMKAAVLGPAAPGLRSSPPDRGWGDGRLTTRRRWPPAVSARHTHEQEQQRRPGGDRDGGDEPQAAGVGALAERVDDAEDPCERGEAVQHLPAVDADPLAHVVGEAERQHAPPADDADRHERPAVVAHEGDRQIGDARVEVGVAQQRCGVHDECGERRERERFVGRPQVGAAAANKAPADQQPDADRRAREDERGDPGGAAGDPPALRRERAREDHQDWLVVTALSVPELDVPELDVPESSCPRSSCPRSTCPRSTCPSLPCSRPTTRPRCSRHSRRAPLPRRSSRGGRRARPGRRARGGHDRGAGGRRLDRRRGAVTVGARARAGGREERGRAGRRRGRAEASESVHRAPGDDEHGQGDRADPAADDADAARAGAQPAAQLSGLGAAL